MITLNKLDRKLGELRKTLNGVGKDFNRNLAVAVNDTSRFCKSQISKEIQSTGLNVTQKVIKSGLADSGRATAGRTSVTVTLKKGFRFGLNAFKARQTKKGVTYRITKGGGAGRITNAFIPTRYGQGKVYVRQGKERGPLRQMRGVSPFGVCAKNKKESLVAKKTQAELIKQIDRRIRFLLLKASGKI
jgi:hypothetical protein